MKSLNFVFILFFVITSSHLALAKSVSGVFMVVKGDVKVLKANKESLKAKVNLSVTAGDTIVSGADSRAKIVMEDKNVIHISPKTELKIETYVNNGTQKSVELNLKEGKVRNNVEQTYDGDKNKFIIKTPTAVAGVRGTQFITSFDKGSNQTQITTLTGRVELTNIPTKPGVQQTTVVVNKGETSSASSERPPAPPQAVPEEQMKEIDKETNVSAKDNKKEAAQDSGTTAAAKEKKQTAPKEVRVEDKQDQSSTTFDKVPVIQNAPPTTAPPTFQPPPPPINNLPGDAIRQQNEKTKVKIIPQSTSGR